MSIRAVEELIMKAVGDSDFRQRLESAPEDIFTKYDLTIEEREAVKRVQSSLTRDLEPAGAMLGIVPCGAWW